VVVEDQRTNFGALQADLAAGRQDRMLFYAFDLLYLEGFDLRRSPRTERKRILKSLYDETGLSAPVLYSEHLETDGYEMFEAARRMNLEGIVSKRIDAPYRSDRTESWRKIKTSVRDKFPIVGFIPDPGGIAALYLGKRDGKELRYVGKVGAGFTRATSADLRQRLDALVTPK
jgi:bifunctional non-homologous end joining protein LigD